jgi:hypothetical protein
MVYVNPVIWSSENNNMHKEKVRSLILVGNSLRVINFTRNTKTSLQRNKQFGFF